MPFICGLDQPHDGVRGDRRIHRIAAALEDLDARARGQRLTGGDDAVLRRDFRASGDDFHLWRSYTFCSRCDCDQ